MKKDEGKEEKQNNYVENEERKAEKEENYAKL